MKAYIRRNTTKLENNTNTTTNDSAVNASAPAMRERRAYLDPNTTESQLIRTDYDENYYRIDNICVHKGKSDKDSFVQHNVSYEPKRNFTKIDNDVINWDAMSLEAKGLYTLLMQKTRIPEFVLCKETAKKCCKNGKKSFNRVWDELKRLGFLKLYRIRNINNRYYYEYELLQTPDSSVPDLTNVRLNEFIIDEKEGTICKHFVSDSEVSENSDFVFEYVSDDEKICKEVSETAADPVSEEPAVSSDSAVQNIENAPAEVQEVQQLIDDEKNKVYDVREDGKRRCAFIIRSNDSEKDTSDNDALMAEAARIKDREILREVKYQIDYDYYKANNDENVLPYIDSILSTIMYVMRYNKPLLTVGSQVIPIEEARAKFAKITGGHIDYVCERLSKNRNPITNIRSYLIATLLSAVDTIDMYYQDEAKKDGLL